MKKLLIMLTSFLILSFLLSGCTGESSNQQISLNKEVVKEKVDNLKSKEAVLEKKFNEQNN